MAKLVSKVYGDALYKLAIEKEIDADWLIEAQELQQTLATNPEFYQMMNHPKISKEEKLQIIENIFKGKISDELVGLVRMLVEKGHTKDIEEALKYFIERVYEKNNIALAYVTTPLELSENDKQLIEKRLLETTKYSVFHFDYKVDPELIGGMVIQIGDRVMDSSVKTKLSKLAGELSNIQLKEGECAP